MAAPTRLELDADLLNLLGGQNRRTTLDYHPDLVAEINERSDADFKFSGQRIYSRQCHLIQSYSFLEQYGIRQRRTASGRAQE